MVCGTLLSMNTNHEPCSFQLYHNGAEVWYFTAWYNISTAGKGITTQCESVNTGTYGTGGMGTIPGSNSTIYETMGTNEQSGNGGLNNLSQPPDQNYASGMGGGPNGGYSVASDLINTGATNGTLGCGGGRAFGGATQQVSGGAG